MTEDDTLMRLIHMLDYSKEAVDMAQARSRADLDTDRMFNYLPTPSHRHGVAAFSAALLVGAPVNSSMTAEHAMSATPIHHMTS